MGNEPGFGDDHGGRLTLEAVLATTHVVTKYGRERLSVGALDQLCEQLASQSVPFRFDHDPARPLDIEVVEVEVRARDDGEHALVAVLSVAPQDWKAAKEAFDAAGVPGGFSYTRHEFENVVGPTALVEAAAGPSVIVAADARAFSPEARAAAALSIALRTRRPVEIRRSYSYSFDAEPALVYIEYAIETLGPGVLASAIWDGIKSLMSRRKGQTRFELRRRGDKFSASVTTDSPPVALRALERLDQIIETEDPRLGSTTTVFDQAADEWAWPSPAPRGFEDVASEDADT